MFVGTFCSCISILLFAGVTAFGAEIAGWGTASDPRAQSEIKLEEGKLRITIPPGVHDFWYGRDDAERRYAAPRVLQTVTGDFLAEVKVTSPLSSKALADNSFAVAAGLIAIDSEQHYLRFERNRFISSRQPGIYASWTPPLYDRNGKRITA